MRKENRLASEAEFRRVRQEGRSWSHPLLVLHARRTGTPLVKVGITVSKRYGGAVQRNRFRRRVRELLRARLDDLRPGWDVVVVARPAAAKATSLELASALEHLTERAHLTRMIESTPPLHPPAE